jgi:hypothetical protein
VGLAANKSRLAALENCHVAPIHSCWNSLFPFTGLFFSKISHDVIAFES